MQRQPQVAGLHRLEGVVFADTPLVIEISRYALAGRRSTSDRASTGEACIAPAARARLYIVG